MEVELNILCFIFSWKGQYENAVFLEKQFSKLGLEVIVINSDDEVEKGNWINIGDECYFSDQFRKALEIFNKSEAEFFFHVQADASYEDWRSVISSAESSFSEYQWGVFAPNVDDTFYISTRTDVFDLGNDKKVVATTDNTCWIVHKDIINELNNNINLMEGNHLGWGWDLLICGFSHIKQRKVIRDYSITVNHPKSTGYMKETAEKEMFDMFGKCPDELKRVIYYIKQEPNKICEYYGVQVEEKGSILIYDTEIM